MATKYFISLNGSSEGPFSVGEITTKVEAKQIAWTDYLFDEKASEWVMILEHPEFSGKVLPTPPAARTPNADFTSSPEAGTDELKEKAWFLLKDGNNYGPFSKIEVVQMLQSRQLFEYDFIWHDKFTAWKRIAECPDFQPQEIRSLKDSGQAEVAEIFFRRRHARMKYGCSLIVHDNTKVFRGTSMEISAGGVGVVIETANFDIGHTLFLHFKPGNGVPPFNALCQVVNKNTLRNIPHGPGAPVKYGLKFTNISQEVRDSITTFTTHKAA